MHGGYRKETELLKRDALQLAQYLPNDKERALEVIKYLLILVDFMFEGDKTPPHKPHLRVINGKKTIKNR